MAHVKDVANSYKKPIAQRAGSTKSKSRESAFFEIRSGMLIVDVHRYFRRCDLMMLWMVNDRNEPDLPAGRWNNRQ